jgi:epidermal growth factor receptor substrate 15
MAVLLPVGPGGLYGDLSLEGASGPSPNNANTSGIPSEGGANDENSPVTTWTQSDQNGTQSFRDALNSSQQAKSSAASKGHKPTADKPTVPIPVQFAVQPVTTVSGTVAFADAQSAAQAIAAATASSATVLAAGKTAAASATTAAQTIATATETISSTPAGTQPADTQPTDTQSAAALAKGLAALAALEQNASPVETKASPGSPVATETSSSSAGGSTSKIQSGFQAAAARMFNTTRSTQQAGGAANSEVVSGTTSASEGQSKADPAQAEMLAVAAKVSEAAGKSAAPSIAASGSSEAAAKTQSTQAQPVSTDASANSATTHSLTAAPQSLAEADAQSSQQESKQDGSSSRQNASNSHGTISWAGQAGQSAASTIPATSADAKVAGSDAAERIGVIQQISDQMSASAASTASNSGQQTVTLNVQPEHWGQLTINLTMTSPQQVEGQAPQASGAVTATIVAQTDAVRDALQSQVKDLQNSLQNAGFKLQKLDIITAGAATGTVAASHSSSQADFGSNTSQNNSSSQHAQQSQAGASSQDASGQRSGQQFASLFGGNGQDGVRADWLPSVGAASEPTDADRLTPIGIVEATTASASTSRVNLLA